MVFADTINKEVLTIKESSLSYDISVQDRPRVQAEQQLERVKSSALAELSRSQFFEALVRLAGLKYIDYKEHSSYYTPTRILIEDEILPKTLLVPPEEFRKNFIWQHRVDNLFKLNEDGLGQLYERYA